MSVKYIATISLSGSNLFGISLLKTMVGHSNDLSTPLLSTDDIDPFADYVGAGGYVPPDIDAVMLETRQYIQAEELRLAERAQLDLGTARGQERIMAGSERNGRFGS